MLNAGRLRSRVHLMRAVEQDNGRGGYTTNWQRVTTMAAEVEGLNGRESVMDKVLQGISVYRITVRWRDDLKPEDQLRYGDLDLNMRSISDPDGRRERLLIIADTESVRTTV